MIKRLRVTVDGKTYDVTVEMADEVPGQVAAPPTVVAPAVPASSAPALSAPQSSPPARPEPASAGPATPGDVPSPLAGRVTAIVVNAGQAVKEGDHLLTLEAMKMNTFVFAPKGGKIAEIKTGVGDAVEENQILMRIA
jgi:biotin carboxyl carrier protein